MVLVSVALLCVHGILSLAFPAFNAGWSFGAKTGVPGGSIWMLLGIVVTLLSLGASATSYFASMLYVRWLAPRIPNVNAYKRSRKMMWAGPLLMTVGLLLLGLGPLIALVLYYNLFEWIRKDLKRIRAEQVEVVAA
jgi:hypothetical protein